MSEGMFQWCQTAGKAGVGILSPIIEKALYFLERSLVCHDEEKLPLQLLLRVLLVLKTMSGVDFIDLELSEPFQPLDSPDRVQEILHRADGFKDQRLFRLKTKRIILYSKAMAIHSLLEPLELRC